MQDIPLATANALNTAANVAAILGSILAVIGGVGTFWTGAIRDRYADAQAQKLENSTAVAKLDAAKANESNTRLQLQLEKERAERIRLEIKVAPRALTDEQRAKLITALKATQWKKAEFIWHGAGEPEHYARNLASAFEAAGIHTEIHTLGIFIPSAWGLIVVRTTNSTSTQLNEILEKIGLKSSIYETNEVVGQKDHPTILVGDRND